MGAFCGLGLGWQRGLHSASSLEVTLTKNLGRYRESSSWRSSGRDCLRHGACAAQPTRWLVSEPV